jgi:hypothetical protein
LVKLRNYTIFLQNPPPPCFSRCFSTVFALGTGAQWLCSGWSVMMHHQSNFVVVEEEGEWTLCSSLQQFQMFSPHAVTHSRDIQGLGLYRTLLLSWTDPILWFLSKGPSFCVESLACTAIQTIQKTLVLLTGVQYKLTMS